MKAIIVAIALSLWATPAGAWDIESDPSPFIRLRDTNGGGYQNGSSANKANILEGVALNAATALRTITLNTEGLSRIKVLVFATRAAYDSITAAFSCSRDGDNYAPITSRAISAGDSKVSVMVDTITTSVSVNYLLEYDVVGCHSVQVLFGGASAGSSDLANVQAIGTVGG